MKASSIYPTVSAAFNIQKEYIIQAQSPIYEISDQKGQY
jgi:hypothetical protein